MLACKPYYETHLGRAYLGDCLRIMRQLPDDSVNLVMTSPPFGLAFKKEYGNPDSDDYVEWFLPHAREMKRLIKKDGSIVIDIGGAWKKGNPTRSLYQFKLLLTLCEEVGLHLAQDFYWFRPAALPAPAEWVAVRRIRVKDSVNCIWWLSKTEWPKASNRNVLQPYSKDMIRLLQKGYRSKLRPSGHFVTPKFMSDRGGAIPPNLLQVGGNESNSHYLKACGEAGLRPHPARFPREIPEFFIKLTTEETDWVLDPFAGSNVTGEAAEFMNRRWIAIEIRKDYLEGSLFRFEEPELFRSASAR
ncbi:MAG: site-specific DNA-methyltransferase [Acidobacteria bacterium]|nr:site-specific DNA-methyltransferase [Acidobacteriota bacterium]